MNMASRRPDNVASRRLKQVAYCRLVQQSYYEIRFMMSLQHHRDQLAVRAACSRTPWAAWVNCCNQSIMFDNVTPYSFPHRERLRSLA